jgi:hypothetical protein
MMRNRSTTTTTQREVTVLTSERRPSLWSPSCFLHSKTQQKPFKFLLAINLRLRARAATRPSRYAIGDPTTNNRKEEEEDDDDDSIRGKTLKHQNKTLKTHTQRHNTEEQVLILV